MIVVDTHAWIWWTSGSSKLGRRARAALSRPGAIGVPAISLWEVGMLVARGRLTLDRPVLSWLRAALELPHVELLPLTPDIAVEATELEGRLHGDPADRLIVATALRHKARLATRDERISESGLVETLW